MYRSYDPAVSSALSYVSLSYVSCYLVILYNARGKINKKDTRARNVNYEVSAGAHPELHPRLIRNGYSEMNGTLRIDITYALE